ncbi:hydroxymyristoyl-ACP dehydratase [Hymenobacter sp. ASUV-10]|uniref:Hydroxymyristoyl-ACP dehydratase n=1 Tax=Hymenobacter aranciens TaxID=3063996 RepID=A0ABT9BC25_9BACT|nr:hydroxymyristoyl-ACP dehydratase [Hymenobacter sp. ASUV-10]MDO7875812.1 hydroxymyristoyl-ACP dehydratase [Hymenobacter sp. ASUV-10]
MFQPEFYSFTSFASDGNSSVEARFLLNPSHPVFEGHFPGQPVVPGVCMLQIIKEGLEKALGKKILLAQAANIKFLSMLVPAADKEIILKVEFSVSREILISNASLSAYDEFFIKLSNARYLFASSAE